MTIRRLNKMKEQFWSKLLCLIVLLLLFLIFPGSLVWLFLTWLGDEFSWPSWVSWVTAVILSFVLWFWTISSSEVTSQTAKLESPRCPKCGESLCSGEVPLSYTDYNTRTVFWCTKCDYTDE